MATTVPIPLTILAPGVHDFGPASIADNLTTSQITLDRTVAGGLNSQPATTTCTAQIMQSNDGGATWTMIVGAGTIGGVVPAPGGVTATNWIIEDGFLPGTGRQVKATVTVTGTSVAVQGTLTLQ